MYGQAVIVAGLASLAAAELPGVGPRQAVSSSAAPTSTLTEQPIGTPSTTEQPIETPSTTEQPIGTPSTGSADCKTEDVLSIITNFPTPPAPISDAPLVTAIADLCAYGSGVGSADQPAYTSYNNAVYSYIQDKGEAWGSIQSSCPSVVQSLDIGMATDLGPAVTAYSQFSASGCASSTATTDAEPTATGEPGADGGEGDGGEGDGGEGDGGEGDDATSDPPQGAAANVKGAFSVTAFVAGLVGAVMLV